MNNSLKSIQESIIAGQPVIKIISYEEKRVEGLLSKLCEQLLKSKNVITWDINNGLILQGKSIPDTTDPIKALDYIISLNTSGFIIFKDLTQIMKDSAKIIRKIRDVYRAFKNTKKFLFLLSPDPWFPDDVKKEIDVIDFEIPDYNELHALFIKFTESMKKAGKQVNLSEQDIKDITIGVQGLTLDEAYKAFKKIFSSSKVIDKGCIAKIHEEKKQLILKEGVLEYFPHQYSIDDLGGLDNLKIWLEKRKNSFSKEAEAYGLKKPRGILAMGISGCGKSLSAKIISALWRLPLYRLDMNLVYSGMSGSPELVFSRALKTMDSVAPAVLWLDEIESGISDKSGEGAGSRILGYFLTWMQEHKSEIFVAATANRIDLLPAELLRRGRFDELFFIDLPTRQEREEIFGIHLASKGNDLNDFNIAQLAQITKGWSGSEIEQVIISAMFEAFNEKRKMVEDDLFVIFGSTVPLSTTMEEQIKKIRSWAHNRAARASASKEY